MGTTPQPQTSQAERLAITEGVGCFCADASRGLHHPPHSFPPALQPAGPTAAPPLSSPTTLQESQHPPD